MWEFLTGIPSAISNVAKAFSDWMAGKQRQDDKDSGANENKLATSTTVLKTVQDGNRAASDDAVSDLVRRRDEIP